MGMIANLWGKVTRPSTALTVPQAPPSLIGMSGIANASMGDFRSSSANDGPSLVWARYQTPLMSGWYGSVTPYATERSRSIAAETTADLAERLPALAAVVDSSLNTILGPNGLTLSSKPNATRLGISVDQARILSSDIEEAWNAWINDPLECDHSGRHDGHSLVSTLVLSWMHRGEAVALLEWEQTPFSMTYTKLRLLSPLQIDQTVTRSDKDTNTYAGVTFNKAGSWIGCHIRPHALGNTVQMPATQFVAAFTPWGRPRIIHTGELREPNQVRYRTPLTAALTPAKARETAAEFVLDGFLVQNQVAATITTPLPAAAALGKLEGTDPLIPAALSGTVGAGGAPGGVLSNGWQAERAAFYSKVKIGFNPGR